MIQQIIRLFQLNKFNNIINFLKMDEDLNVLEHEGMVTDLSQLHDCVHQHLCATFSLLYAII